MNDKQRLEKVAAIARKLDERADRNARQAEGHRAAGNESHANLADQRAEAYSLIAVDLFGAIS